MAAKNIQAFALRTEIIVDAVKAHAEYQKAEKSVEKYGQTVTKVGKEASKAFDGQAVGKKFGADFGASAVSSITGSINSLGQTLGAVIGTAIAPGIGTAIGSTLGSGIDSALQKISGPIMQAIAQGIDLNKEIEKATVHFTAFGGSEKQAAEHLKELKALSISSGLDLRDLIQGSERLEEFSGKLGDTSTKLKAAAAATIVFAHGKEGFDAVANALGYMTEKGELSVLMLRKLERAEGVPGLKYLAQAFGYTEQKMSALITAGKIRGDVAAQIIAESTIRDKGPRAAAIMQGTTYGKEAQFGALTGARFQEGTVNATKALGDFYSQSDAILASPQAQQFVAFIDKTTGSLVTMVEKGLKVGLNLTTGIADGMGSGEALKKITGAGENILGALEGYLEIKSPSERAAREIGEPLGEGVGIGMARKFKGYLQGKGADEIRAALEQLRQDPRIKAFLDLIGASEVGNDPNKFARLFGPLGHVANPGAFNVESGGWPGMRVKSPTLGKTVWTHPLGPGQIEPGTAKAFSRATGITGPMDAEMQQLIMTWLITQTKGALEKVLGGDAAGAMGSLKGTWESFAINSPGKKAGLVNQFNASVAGKPIDRGNPMPVYVVQDIQGGAADVNRQASDMKSLFVGQGETWKRGGAAGPSVAALKLNLELPILETNLEGIVADVRDLTGALKQTTPAAQGARLALATIALGAVPIMKGVNDAAGLALTAVNADAMINKSAAEVRQAGQITLSMTDQLVNTIQQVSGMIPGQQTVSKKRGLFSKILGFAAPFLSFIPGFGPILSQIAGIASQGLAGNYGGMVSGIAGLHTASGSIFRSSSSGSGSGSSSGSSGAGRATGGPVRFGNLYRVGERGAEWFTPEQNGHIIPNGAMGGGGLHPDVLNLLSEFRAEMGGLRAEIGRLRSFPPDHIVAAGANGLTRALDHDAGLVERMGRRLNL